MKSVCSIILLLPALLLSNLLAGQYILNGSAVQNTCNCYTLTPEVNTQSGSVWNANKINLNNPFDFIFNVFPGCKDATGADGIVFILQPISTSVGTSGGGMGFQGISPSIGIALDSWQNTDQNDPIFDHISIQANGNLNHSSDLAGPIQASSNSSNIEDCQWHTFRIVWDPATKLLQTYFDGVFRLQATVDLIANIFNNDPMVYWGFSAGTGGSNNLQQFCTALNPRFNTNSTNDVVCLGTTVNFTNTSESFAPIANFYWDFGDGNNSTAANPPHLYTAPGIYTVKLAITGLDGCRSDTLRKTVIVGDFPVANFDVYDTCDGFIPRIIDRSQVTVGNVSQWEWKLNGTTVSNAQNPQLTSLAPGTYQLELVSTSIYGCNAAPVVKQLIIKPRPTIDATVINGCVNEQLTFTGQQIDNATTITQWNWAFGDAQTSNQQNPQHTYTSANGYTITITADASNGCRSPVITKQVIINSRPVISANTTDGCVNTQLSFTTQQIDNATLINQWAWDFGDAQTSSQQNPQHTYNAPGIYTVTVVAISDKGCGSAIITKQVIVHPRPVINSTVANGCTNEQLSFTALQVDNATTISQWNWDFGGGQTSTQQNPQYSFANAGSYTVTAIATSDMGCASATESKQVVINPKPVIDVVVNTGCINEAVNFTGQQIDNSTTITQWNWTFGDGQTSNQQNPQHTYVSAGTYTVTLTGNGNNGCNSLVITKQVIIYTKPAITAVMPAGCMNTALSFTAQQTDNATSIAQWNWAFGDGQTSNQQNPQHTYNNSGTYTVTVTAVSDKGCSSPIVNNQVVVNPKPIINAAAINGCVNEPVTFSAQQTDNATNITQWNWAFGDGQTSNQQNTLHTYNSKGSYAVTVTASADNGCSSTVTTIPVFINQAVANAGNDTIAIKDEPFQLQGSGGVTYNWSPATGLNDASLQIPTAVLQDDITYTLTVTTAEGCEDTDQVKITVFKSSAVYVPTGFTPNGDGLNDLMRPYCAGIKKLDYFTVYNRWGQMIFTTQTFNDGWNGLVKGSKQSTGTYIWTLRAVDYAGKVFQLKGMTTLLR